MDEYEQSQVLEAQMLGTRTLVIVSMLTGLVIALLTFPEAGRSQDALLDRATILLADWIFYSVISLVWFWALFRVVLNRRRVAAFARQPYPWLVTALFVGLGGLPFLVSTGLYWPQAELWFLRFYGMLCFGPNLIIAILAAAFLSPRLNLRTGLRIFAYGALLWLAGLGLFYGLSALVFQRVVLPTWEEGLSFAAFYWVACIAVWAGWTAWPRLVRLVPAGVQLAARRVQEYRPDLNFMVFGLVFLMLFPTTILLAEYAYGTQVEEYLAIVFTMNAADLALARTLWGTLPLLAGLALFVGILYLTIKFLTAPGSFSHIFPNPNTSLVFALLWLFCLWWMYYAATALLLNFIHPGEFATAGHVLLRPDFRDFLFYAFALMTSSGGEGVLELGEAAHWLRILMTGTGVVMLILLGEVVGMMFLRRGEAEEGRRGTL